MLLFAFVAIIPGIIRETGIMNDTGQCDTLKFIKTELTDTNDIEESFAIVRLWQPHAQ